MSSKEKVLEMLKKMESEGMDYYFNHYTSYKSLKKELPFLKDFLPYVKEYETAYGNLESALQRLKSDFEISEEDLEEGDC